MDKLTFKRYYYLILLLFFILLLAIIFSETRIISYNFGDYKVKTEGIGYNYENEVDLLDDSLVHDINIDITQEQYDYIVNSYKENSEKEWLKVNITIDGVTLNNVGLRLKGNLTLRQTLGTDKGGAKGDGKENELEEENEDIQSEREKILEENNVEVDSTKTPGFLIKFDKYNEGQTYQGLEKVALRIGSDNSLLNELISDKLFKEIGLIAPSASYGAVKLGDVSTQLYVVTEVLDDNYVDKYFPDTEGVLYKSGNSVGFHYEGDDPTLYTDKFKIKGSENKYDLSLLIKLLKFVTNSTDEEFEENLGDYVDIDSLIGLMVMDELVGNSDSFAGMGSNYYVYINSDTGKAYFLPWDYNLSFGGLGGGGGGGMGGPGGEDNRGGNGDFNIDGENLNNTGSVLTGTGFANNPGNFKDGNRTPPEGNGGGDRGGPGGNMGNGGGGMSKNTNDLKEKLMANETFAELYNNTLESWKQKIYGSGLAEEVLDYYVKVFFSYKEHSKLVDDETYNKNVETLKSYIEKQNN